MKIPATTNKIIGRLRCPNRRSSRIAKGIGRLVLAGAAMLSLTGSGLAQSTQVGNPQPQGVDNPPSAATAAPGGPAAQTYGTSVVAPMATVPGLLQESSPLQWGPVNVRPHVVYRLLYGDGFQSTPGHPLTTAINAFAPGVLFAMGDHWTLDYTATKTFYSNRAFSDTLDHAALLTGATTYNAWSMQLTQSFGISNQPLIETGSQTKQESYATALQVIYGFASQMQFEFNAGQNVALVDVYPSTREWYTTDWLHYRYAPELDTAVGLGLGYVDVSPGPNMSYVRPQARVTWQFAPKTTLQIQGGLERRKSDARGAPDMNNGIFSVSLNYQPVDTTTLTVLTSRSVAAAFYQAQVTRNTSWSVGLNQRLLGEFHLTAMYAHQEADYLTIQPTAPAGRSDKFDSLNVGLATTFFSRLAVSTFYQHNRNASNTPGFGFSGNQVGLEIGYRY